MEFILNEFITLKLEDGKTNIYIKGKLFLQCKKLILNLDVNFLPVFSDLSSIDTILEERKRFPEGNTPIIPPSLEFWGHCSNLQTWLEEDYNTQLLHSNLAFPLLKKLVEVGDTKASKVLKKEILKRFELGEESTILFLLEEQYLDYFTQEELVIIFENLFPKFKNSKAILTFLRAFFLKNVSIAIVPYRVYVRDYIFNDESDGSILKNHIDLFTKDDLIFLMKEFQNIMNREKRIKLLDMVIDYLSSQYNVSFSISELITNLLFKEEQNLASEIILDSPFPYVRLDFQADDVRRRVWEEILYYDFYDGRVDSIELLCSVIHQDKFYKILKDIIKLRKLKNLNLLIFCGYNFNLVRKLALKTHARKICIYNFFENKQIPQTRVLRDVSYKSETSH